MAHQAIRCSQNCNILAKGSLPTFAKLSKRIALKQYLCKYFDMKHAWKSLSLTWAEFNQRECKNGTWYCTSMWTIKINAGLSGDNSGLGKLWSHGFKRMRKVQQPLLRRETHYPWLTALNLWETQRGHDPQSGCESSVLLSSRTILFIIEYPSPLMSFLRD